MTTCKIKRYFLRVAYKVKYVKTTDFILNMECVLYKRHCRLKCVRLLFKKIDATQPLTSDTLRYFQKLHNNLKRFLE